MDVSQLLELAIEVVALAALATTPVFLIVLAITTLGRRWLAPWARQTLWSLVLLRLLLPVSIGSPLSLQPAALRLLAWVLPQFETSNTELSSETFDLNTQATAAYEPVAPIPSLAVLAAAPQSPAVDWVEFAIQTCLLSGLLGGSALVALWTVITTLRLRRLVRSGAECRREDWLSLLAEGQRRFGVSGAVALRIVPKLRGPATYGWWRPAILLPDDAATWSSVEVRHVLWHELAHIGRYDVAANWVLAVVRVLHWWNPMFWWAQRAWLAERELACDALVLRQLEGSDVREYGQTLLRFLERLASGGAGWPTTAPGFVMFWGRKREARRRLAELPQLARPEQTWRRWLAGGLIGALAIAGLTDAATSREAPPPAGPLELPAGTLWSLVPPAEPANDEPRIMKSYALAATIERLRQDDHGLTAPIAALSVQQTLQVVLQPTTWGDGLLSPQPAASKCELLEEQLIVQATAAQHEEIQRLLRQWSQHGMRQVSVESRFITTGLSLKDLLPGAGGTVLNLAAVTDDSLTDRQQNSVPAFMRVLTPAEAEALSDQLQADPRSNLMFAPKVTLFDGQAASLLCGTQRPFVTGLRTTDQGSEPQISVVSEGIRLQLRTQLTADAASTLLSLQYQESRILDVEVLETTIAGESHNIQIPQVSRSVVSTAATLPAGHSLLVAPLRRDPQGQLHLCLLRPLQVD